MTIKEAIQYCVGLQNYLMAPRSREVLDMAIKALKFKEDILSLWDNYHKQDMEPYWPEDLENDFFDIMHKWEERNNERI